MTVYRSRPQYRACTLGLIIVAVVITDFLANRSHIPVLAILLLVATWLIVGGVRDSTVRLDDTGISRLSFAGWQHWSWPDITEAHLSGTGTLSGIAVYRGSTVLQLGESQFPQLVDVARYIESHVRPEAIRSSWAAG